MTMPKSKTVEKPAERDPDPSGPPIVLLPATATAGSSAFELTVQGDGFDATTKILWDGSEVATTLVSVNEVSTLVTPPAAGGTSEVWTVTTLPPEIEGDPEVVVTSQGATFTWLEPEPQPGTDDETLTAQLRSWGLSSEPSQWAPTRWQSSIQMIRACNLGWAEMSTVQGVLDTTFPLNNLQAGDVCLSPPFKSEPAVKAKKGKDGRFTLSTDGNLPAEHVTWFVDGNVVGQGELATALAVGEHSVMVQVAVSGAVFTKTATVEGADVTPEPEPEPEPEGDAE